MATMTTTEEDMLRSEKLEVKKEREMATRPAPKKSRCSALRRLGKAGLVAALGLLGHAVQENMRLEAEMRNATPPNYVSVAENTVANMTKYIRELEKSNAELVKAQDTLNKLLENNPTNPTQPYSKQQWLKKEIAKASGEEVPEEEDTSKAVVKSKGRKKGGYFNEHFNLTF